jgi:hypothetical protein
MPSQEETPKPNTTQDDAPGPAPDGQVVELSDTVAEEIEERVRKRQELVEEAQEKADEFEEARERVDEQMSTNQAYMDAVATLNEVDPDEYVYDARRQALRPMTRQEKAQQAAQEQAPMQQETGSSRRETTDMDTNDAVLFIRENGLENLHVPEEEDRPLVLEAIDKARG